MVTQQAPQRCSTTRTMALTRQGQVGPRSGPDATCNGHHPSLVVLGVLEMRIVSSRIFQRASLGFTSRTVSCIYNLFLRSRRSFQNKEPRADRPSSKATAMTRRPESTRLLLSTSFILKTFYTISSGASCHVLNLSALTQRPMFSTTFNEAIHPYAGGLSLRASHAESLGFQTLRHPVREVGPPCWAMGREVRVLLVWAFTICFNAI